MGYKYKKIAKQINFQIQIQYQSSIFRINKLVSCLRNLSAFRSVLVLYLNVWKSYSDSKKLPFLWHYSFIPVVTAPVL